MEKITVVGKDDNINVKHFETLEEFQQYYNLHKEEINKLSTVKLNRIYHIKDYKITRRTNEKGEEKKLYFRREFKTLETPDDSRFDEIESSIVDIKKEIDKIKEQLIEIINALNSLNA